MTDKKLATEKKVKSYMNEVVKTFSKAKTEIVDVLKLIRDYSNSNKNDLQLEILAVRRYLRKGDDDVHLNWSWSDEEARSKKREEPAKTLYAEANKVRKKFAQENPKHVLVITPLRGFEKQVKSWNRNHTVKQAGAKLLKEIRIELAKDEYPDIPTGIAVSEFKNRLKKSTVSPEPTNAAPGTSNHGRGIAVDLIIKEKKGSIIAGINSKTIKTDWVNSGWLKKLKTACKGSKLKGPLKNPYEPWHWEL